jgi:hypothetical protein
MIQMSSFLLCFATSSAVISLVVSDIVDQDESFDGDEVLYLDKVRGRSRIFTTSTKDNTL